MELFFLSTTRLRDVYSGSSNFMMTSYVQILPPIPEFGTPSVLLSKCIFNVSGVSVIYSYPLVCYATAGYLYIYTDHASVI